MIKLSKVYTELSTGMHKAVHVNTCFHSFDKINYQMSTLKMSGGNASSWLKSA